MNLFVYGPLMFREVLEAVVGRDLVRRAGTLNGYMQLRLIEESQAALVPFPDAATEGVVYMGVDEAALKHLDAFQGERFRREKVNVQADDGEWVEAETHCFRMSGRKHLSAKPWDEAEYRQRHLKQFLSVKKR